MSVFFSTISTLMKMTCSRRRSSLTTRLMSERNATRQLMESSLVLKDLEKKSSSRRRIMRIYMLLLLESHPLILDQSEILSPQWSCNGKELRQNFESLDSPKRISKLLIWHIKRRELWWQTQAENSLTNHKEVRGELNLMERSQLGDELSKRSWNES